MARPAELPPIDLGRTWCEEDGSEVVFCRADGGRIRLRSHAVDPPVAIWDRRSIASLYGLEGGPYELLPDGLALDMYRGKVVATGEDFSPLLDLALAAGLAVAPPSRPAEAPDA